MTERPFEHTIDWEEFWRTATEAERTTARPGQFDKPDQFRRFFAETGVPETFASVGCGPADAEFELARAYPDIEFRCFDASETIVAENCERASAEGLDNLSFGVAALPEPAIDRQFDLVYCYATLTYVREVETAIRRLYERVGKGGVLVFDYPNRYTRATYRDLWPEDVDDPERFRRRFGLVIDGENLLSHERIRDVLGTWPRSFYAAVDREDPPRNSPCVYVPK